MRLRSLWFILGKGDFVFKEKEGEIKGFKGMKVNKIEGSLCCKRRRDSEKK